MFTRDGWVGRMGGCAVEKRRGDLVWNCMVTASRNHMDAGKHALPYCKYSMKHSSVVKKIDLNLSAGILFYWDCEDPMLKKVLYNLMY